MKHIAKIFSVMIGILLAIGLAQPLRFSQAQTTGFHVSGRSLLDANNNNFIMRGVNHAHTWYPTQTSSFANIKATGANTVRVVLASGQLWTRNSGSDVANVIQLCKTNRLICVLEVHDTTGFGEQANAATLAQAASYWTSSDIRSAINGQEAYVIINIGNEPYGNTNTAAWASATTSAISSMRSAGIRHTIMVDAPNWGQDWEFRMRDNAASIFNSDPQRNIVFSIHMYGVFDTAGEVQSYLATFVANGLPLVVGEFGHNHSDGDPDENAIMAQAQAQGIGYLGWSWSGNGGGVEYLDMVNGFNASSLTSWGDRIVNGANGIRQTSQEASVYSGVNPTNTPTPSTPGGGAVNRVRFFPRASFANRMTGGIFQGSNTSSTSGFVNLATIASQPPNSAWSELSFSNSTVYRYLRYLSPNSGFGNVAEVEFYSGSTRLTGTGFGTAGSWNNSGNTFDRALDGSTSTFFDAPSGNGNYVGIDRGGTGTPTPTSTPTSPTPPTNTPTGPTATPGVGGLKVQLVTSGTDNTQQASFKFKLVNTGTSARSNISTRVYFTLDGSQPASNYVLEKYWDQSGVATISGPTQASGSTYFFTVTFGSASLAAGGAWEFHTTLRLSDWSTNFSGANDWWHNSGALPASFTDWARIPAYTSGSLVWGSAP